MIDMRLLGTALKMQRNWREEHACEVENHFRGSMLDDGARGCVLRYRDAEIGGVVMDTHEFADEVSGLIEVRP